MIAVPFQLDKVFDNFDEFDIIQNQSKSDFGLMMMMIWRRSPTIWTFLLKSLLSSFFFAVK